MPERPKAVAVRCALKEFASAASVLAEQCQGGAEGREIMSSIDGRYQADRGYEAAHTQNGDRGQIATALVRNGRKT
jgi:hypothetical protein